MRAIPVAQEKCSYKYDGWTCPLGAEHGGHFCIFHLPADEKNAGDFWLHLASYLSALFVHAGTEETNAFESANRATHWIFREANPVLTQLYADLVQKGQPWEMKGFVFKEWDSAHGFGGIAFPEVDFTNAEFDAKADFRGSEFNSQAKFRGAKFRKRADFEFAKFRGDTVFDDASFAEVASFRRVESNQAIFSFDGAAFTGMVDFSYGTLRGRIWFSGATFAGLADFSHRTFDGEANFERTTFLDKADFSSWQPGHPRTSFKGRTSFHSARFDAEVSFEGARFEGAETSFRNTEFLGPVLMRRAEIQGQFFLNYAEIHNQIFFDGTILGDNCVVLLWGLNFVHGVSNVAMETGRLHGRSNGNSISLEEDPRSGRINEPAGQVVFRDIKGKMNHVSFLHTDVLTDRLLVRFSNVKWETNPERFILDAKFAFVGHKEWSRQKLIEETGLPEWAIDNLPELYFADQPVSESATPQDRARSKALQLLECEQLVKQDVERIAREIRLSYEKYGHYGDAGDYYVAEMDFRRTRLPPEAWLKRPAMWIYRWVSRYGESPTLAFAWFVGVWLVAAFFYMYSGFSFGTRNVDYLLRPNLDIHWDVVGKNFVDFLHALAYSFVSLMPGYFRFSTPTPWPTPVTPFLVVAEAVIGVGLLTLFLLAIRRRFRR